MAQCAKSEWRNNELVPCKQPATTRCENCGDVVCHEHADYDQSEKGYFGRLCIDCSVLTQIRK